jgi:hypothetical protein
MALYKKKYTSGEAKHGGNREHSRPNAAKRRHSGAVHSGAARNEPAHSDAASVTRINISKTEQRESQKPQESVAPAKKGILSKLKGLFRKK